MRSSLGVLVIVAVCAASCGGADPAAPPTAVQSSAIQGGTTDSTHTFAVGVVQTSDIQDDMVAYCTGVLLAPNLVATARHCVAQLSSTTIDCATSNFGGVLPTSDVYVTTDTIIDPRDLDNPQNLGDFVTVSSIIVPTGANQTSVCGNDLALLILGKSISLPQYVVPTITPGMTDPQYQPTVTAIGYGVDTPTDTAGSSAGTRRIKENVALQCIPDDTNPSETDLDCFASDPQAAPMYMTASEFMSGDSTCEGDSGSGAFEQSNFDQGKWVAFGVLSRGGTSTDGTTCIQPIYSRFDAWGSLLVGAAEQAAAAGGYAVPAWAAGSAADAGSMSGGSSSGGEGGTLASSGAVSSSDDAGGDEAGVDGSSSARSSPGAGADGAACVYSSDCASGVCASTDTVGPVCASACAGGGSCASGFACQSGYCFPAGSTTGGGSSGCAVSGAAGPAPAPLGSLAVWGLGLAGLAAGRRRGRKGTKHLSASGHPFDPASSRSLGDGARARDLLN